MDSATTVREFLFTLLLKVAVASSFAALLVRWNTLRRVLFTEQRDPDQKLKLMLFMVPPLILGVTLRLIGGAAYSFADMSLEGAFLMGLLGGRVAENLEQHAQRNEARAPPAAPAEGAHGRAVAADQSALSFQHAEYGDLADSFRPGRGSRRGAEAEQHSAQTAAQARNVCAAPRGIAVHRRLSGHRSGAVRPRKSGNCEARRRRGAGRVCAQHAVASDCRELLEAWPGAENWRRKNRIAHCQSRWPSAHRD